MKSHKLLHRLIWTLIYGGLLIVVTGLYLRRSEAALGYGVMSTGALCVLVGVGLIYARSRMKDD